MDRALASLSLPSNGSGSSLPPRVSYSPYSFLFSSSDARIGFRAKTRRFFRGGRFFLFFLIFWELVEFTWEWNFSFLSLSFFFVWLRVVIYLVVRVFAGFLLAIFRESGNWWNEVSPLGFHIIRIFPPFRSRGINYSKSFYYFPPFDLCNWGIVCRDLLLLKFLLFFPSFISNLARGITSIQLSSTKPFPLS